MINKQSETNYTFEDYIGFAEEVRCEIIDGMIYDMSPAPTSKHQRVSMFLSGEIFHYLKDKKCEVFPAPFDVFLIDENQDLTNCNKIVQPDISVICDETKITERGCVGAPDFIIEIVSPSSKSHDYVRKLNLYNNFKVKEYWIVNSENKTILKYALDGENFSTPILYTFNDKVVVEIFHDLVIDLTDIEDKV